MRWLATTASVLLGVACGGGGASPPPGAVGGNGGTPATSSGSGEGGKTATTSSGTSTGAGGSTARCPDGPFGDPLADAPNPTTVAGGYDFLEGPVWVGDRLFFSDMHFSGAGADGVPPATIYRLTPPNTVDTFLDPIGSNGLGLGVDGAIVACTHDQRSLSRIDPQTGDRTTIVGTYGGDAFNAPNDVVVGQNGTIYFTDPTWQLGNRPPEIGFKGVYRLPSGATEPVLVADDFGSPNGIALSPDETTLYVVDDSSGAVRRFAVGPDGSTTADGTVATVSGADGMAVDCAGNLYVSSHGGIAVLTSDGAMLGTLSLSPKPSNATFGGPEGRTLYVTTQTTLYAIELAVPGLP